MDNNYLGLVLKNYQDEKVDELKKKVNELLELGGNKICIFEAPTGSGKTIMAGEFLKRLVNPIDREDGKTFSFIWISVRDLHGQSKKSLEKHFPNEFTYSDFEDLEDSYIKQNEILFLNWESINKDYNVYIRENERGKNLSSIIENTKSQDRIIILIIDESHHTAISEKSTQIKNDIGAKTTLEVSATPIFKNPDAHVKVHFERVIAEGMIKKEISINPEFARFKVDGKSSREMVLDAAIEKRKELAEAFKKEGSNINPLILIQLPNLQKGINDLDKDVLKDVERILDKKQDISEENGKLAIWLAENKTPNLVNIEKSTNEVEVLIFKQAIALGWDCPRAHILVIFRETKERIFLLQTVGRIMRMPEFHHYEDHQELNKGFVFTNLGDIEIAGEIAQDYLTIHYSERDNETYKDIDLPSIHFKRIREKTRLSGEFSKIFQQVAKNIDLKSKIDIKSRNISREIIVDGKIINIDKAKEIEHSSMFYSSPEMEIQTYYDLFCKASTGEFAPIDSMGRIKSALNKFFTQEFNFEYDDIEFYKVILNEKNIEKISNALALAREEYKRTIVEKETDREMETNIWNVPKVLSYNISYRKKEYKKSIMKPYYSRLSDYNQESFLGEEDSIIETEFIKYLDKDANKVKWWFKNGYGEVNYFAVSYTDKFGRQAAFYVDFVVQLSDGRIGLFDTKKGRTAEDAKYRAEGLARYIKEQNIKGKKLFGGIITLVESNWRLNNKEVYNYNPKDWKDWSFLELN
jgi:type III restriction enzyme